MVWRLSMKTKIQHWIKYTPVLLIALGTIGPIRYLEAADFPPPFNIPFEAFGDQMGTVSMPMANMPGDGWEAYIKTTLENLPSTQMPPDPLGSNYGTIKIENIGDFAKLTMTSNIRTGTHNADLSTHLYITVPNEKSYLLKMTNNSLSGPTADPDLVSSIFRIRHLDSNTPVGDGFSGTTLFDEDSNKVEYTELDYGVGMIDDYEVLLGPGGTYELNLGIFALRNILHEDELSAMYMANIEITVIPESSTLMSMAIFLFGFSLFTYRKIKMNSFHYRSYAVDIYDKKRG
jgi:hypothetical protein